MKRIKRLKCAKMPKVSNSGKGKNPENPVGLFSYGNFFHRIAATRGCQGVLPVKK